jgi:hypothetical protein
MMKNKRIIYFNDINGARCRPETDREYWTRQAKGWSLMAVLYLAVTAFIAALSKGDFLPNFIATHVLMFGIAAFAAIFWRALHLLDPNP